MVLFSEAILKSVIGVLCQEVFSVEAVVHCYII